MPKQSNKSVIGKLLYVLRWIKVNFKKMQRDDAKPTKFVHGGIFGEH